LAPPFLHASYIGARGGPAPKFSPKIFFLKKFLPSNFLIFLVLPRQFLFFIFFHLAPPFLHAWVRHCGLFIKYVSIVVSELRDLICLTKCIESGLTSESTRHESHMPTRIANSLKGSGDDTSDCAYGCPNSRGLKIRLYMKNM
jgi:hypothetical protein